MTLRLGSDHLIACQGGTPLGPTVREHGADEIMANITVERLIEHLERSGYVVMCKPGLAPHNVSLGDAIDRAAKIRQEE